MKQLLIILLLAAFAATTVGCGGSKDEKKAKKLEDVLNNGSGTTYDLVKTNEDKGYAVYQDLSTGEYVAFNYKKFDKDTMETYQDYLAAVNPDSDIIGDLDREVTTEDQICH